MNFWSRLDIPDGTPPVMQKTILNEYEVSGMWITESHPDGSLVRSCRRFDDPRTSSRRSGKALHNRTHGDFDNWEVNFFFLLDK
jgi:hypothetical protein